MKRSLTFAGPAQRRVDSEELTRQRLAETNEEEADHAEQKRRRQRERKAARRDLLKNQAGFDTSPLVAIVVPAKNEERFIEECLQSIREQEFDSWECVVIDDGSTDRTLEVALRFERLDSRFSVHSHNRTLGLAASRNTGIALSGAPYLTFLDADDFFYPGSLKNRVESLSSASSSWVAGSYCDWQPTKEQQDRRPPDRSPANRSRVTFIGGPECPFIATAPLLRRDVVEEHGGFNEALPTAEDFDLWIRILRTGYVFEYSPVIGLAYRQKSSGMVFQDTARHAEVCSRIIDWQYQDITDDREADFSRPLWVYQRDSVHSRRLLKSYALAAASECTADQSRIAELLPTTFRLLRHREINSQLELSGGLNRAARAVPKYSDATVRKAGAVALDSTIDRELGDERSQTVATDVLGEGIVGGVGSLLECRERLTERVSKTPAPPTLAITEPYSLKADVGFLLIPMARYHAIEMVAIAEELACLGVNCTFLLDRQFEGQFDDAIAQHSHIGFDSTSSERSLPNITGLYTMNDWGMAQDLVRIGRIRSVPSFARVEGVQDFLDLDTKRIRLPYLSADYALAQGQNDVDNLPRANVEIVGNGRLERLFAMKERASTRNNSAVINSNFTYGVLTGVKQAFLESALGACLSLGLRPVISQHPADGELPPSLSRYVTTDAMSDLLLEVDVLISRFSTVPFEAMAVGTPFVYYNPHIERVPTFHSPKGAFQVADSKSSLIGALEAGCSQLGDYRAISESFFRRQVDIGEQSSDVRTAEFIAGVLGSKEPCRANS